MEIFGVGAPELIFIVIIAILILGPKDMEKAGRTIGHWLNNLVRSDGWFLMQKTTRELRSLPTKLMREANNEIARTEEDIRKELNAQYFRAHNSPASLRPSDLLPPEKENLIIPTPPDEKPEPAPKKKAVKKTPAPKKSSK
jgi:sec-independent protein translocase protein TatB